MRWTRRLALPVLSSLAGLAFAACGGSEAAETGGFEITDSVGVVLVRNPAEAAWTHIPRPTVTEDLRIGTIDGPMETQFGSITGLGVGSDGSIYVLDRQSSNVRVFDRSGAYLRTLGRPGQGPGELDGGMALMVTRADTVWVADGSMSASRLVGFASDGSAAETVPLPRDSRSLNARWDATSAGTFLVQVRANGGAPDILLERDPRTGRVDTLVTLQPPQAGTVGMYDPAPDWAILDDGRIVTGRTDVPRFEIRERGSALSRVVAREFTPGALSEDERADLLDQLRESLRALPRTTASSPEIQRRLDESRAQMIERISVGAFYPAFDGLIAGPRNTFWTHRFRTFAEIEAAGDEGVPNLWDVYDAEGRLLGPIELPRRFSPVHTAGDHLYGTVRDDLGVSYVVRVRIEWQDG